MRAERVDGRGGENILRRAGDDPHGECSVSVIDDVIDGSCFVGGGVASPPGGGCRVPGGVASPPHGLDSERVLGRFAAISPAAFSGEIAANDDDGVGHLAHFRAPFARFVASASERGTRVGSGGGPEERGMGFVRVLGVPRVPRVPRAEKAYVSVLGEAVPGGEADALDLGVAEGFGVSPVVHAMRVRAAHDDGDASVGGPAHAVLGERVGGILREPLALDEVRDDAVTLDAQAAVAVGTDDDEVGVLVRRRGAVEASGPVVESTRARPVGLEHDGHVGRALGLERYRPAVPGGLAPLAGKPRALEGGDHEHLTGHANPARGGKHRRHRARDADYGAREPVAESDSANAGRETSAAKYSPSGVIAFFNAGPPDAQPKRVLRRRRLR